MTPQEKHFVDSLQNRLQQLTGRVDDLVGQFNGFVVELRGQLCELLDAKIVDTKESTK